MTTEKEKYFAFHQFLRLHGIGEFSPSIPEGIGKHLNGVPYEEDLVKIPEFEDFPLPEVEKPPKIDKDEMRKMFTQAQIEASLFEQQEEEEDSNERKRTAPSIDVSLQYVSAGHFVRFKKELNTKYLDESQEFDDRKVKCCMEVSCCNPTVPGFDYCICHFAKDPHFKDQKFLTICSEEGCETVCSAKDGVCHKHKAHK